MRRRAALSGAARAVAGPIEGRLFRPAAALGLSARQTGWHPGKAPGQQVVDDVVENVGFDFASHDTAFADVGLARGAEPSGRRTYRKQVNGDSIDRSPRSGWAFQCGIGEVRGTA